MRRRLLCYYAILACICPSLCLAQIASRVPVLNFEKPPTTEADLPASETIRKDVDEVNLVFSVRDRGGHFVTDLQPHQVQVLDNRRPPESVRLFEAQTNLPLRVGLLVDGSDSVDARFGFEKTAAVNFLRQTLRAGSDQAFAVRFDASVHLVQDWTDNIQQLEQSILGMRVGGETALYDAVRQASEKLSEPSGRFHRRAIILITDGMDNRSHANLAEAIETALRAEAVIYVLSTNSAQTVNMAGELAMARLAEATGGRVLRAEKEKDIRRAFQSIQLELRSQYLLGYKPAEFRPDGSYRTISVKTRNRGGLRVHVRRGYYTRPTKPL